MDYSAAVRAAMLRARNRLAEIDGGKMPQGEWADRLAAEMGENVSRSAVYEWEVGKSTPKATALLAAARLAGVTVERLVYEGQPSLLYEEMAEIRAEIEAMKAKAAKR